MSIVTAKLLYDKICELRPDLSSSITLDSLNKICDDSSTQPFLQWFCKNLSCANILSNEEIKIKNTLHDTGKWLEGEALDAALEEATKDCPDILQLISLDDRHKEDLFTEYEILRESCKKDEEYLQLLRHTIKNLKETENKLDDDIEEAEDILDKKQFETEKVYDNCSKILKDFDRDNRQCSKDVNNLLNVYVNGAKNQGDTILWSQIPIDLFIKQIQYYNHYLGINIRKQFGSTKEEQNENSSDYSSMINDSREKKMDEKMIELSLCKMSLTNSKNEEINTSVQEESFIAMLECTQDIYHNGVLKVPEDSKMQDELLTLNVKKDILEQSVELLRNQQLQEVAQFAETEMLKILKNDALVRLERRKARLEKLENLYSLAGEHGHVYVDLLCTLIEMQSHSLHEIVEFIFDACHCIATEYNLSSRRCEIMQQQQDEYATLVMQSSKRCNAFNQIFISMMFGDDVSVDESLSSALKKYDDLIVDNIDKKLTLKTYLNNEIGKLQNLENKLNEDYRAETQNGFTNSLKPLPYEVSTNYEEIAANVQNVQKDITRIRNQFKEQMRIDASLERERDILWQRYLSDPDTLRMKYEEFKQRANNSHFGNK